MGAREKSMVEERSELRGGCKGMKPNCTIPRTCGIDTDQFNKGLLPMPVAVLARMGIKPRAANGAGYWLVKCPFHKNGKEKHGSLSLHQVNGNFRCFICRACGADVLNLWMKYTGKPFKQAAMELEAWGRFA